jgi:hypothetical protein
MVAREVDRVRGELEARASRGAVYDHGHRPSRDDLRGPEDEHHVSDDEDPILAYEHDARDCGLVSVDKAPCLRRGPPSWGLEHRCVERYYMPW